MRRYEVRVEVQGNHTTGWDYPDNYFPRGWAYKKEAVKCKERAERLGGKGVTIKWVEREEKE